jgi:hypothetical protein
MIEYVMLAFLLLLNGGIVCAWMGRLAKAEGLISPLFFWLPFYLLNYPVRSAFLFFANGTDFEHVLACAEYRFDRVEILVQLCYATLFAITLFSTYCFLIRRRRRRICESAPRRAKPERLLAVHQRFLFTLLFLAYLGVFFYRWRSGALFTLYEDLSDLKRSFAVNLLLLMSELKWLFVCYAAFALQRRFSWWRLIGFVAAVGPILVSAAVSTGKGDVVAAALVWVSVTVVIRKRIPLLFCVCAFGIAVSFAFYSRAARQSGIVRGDGHASTEVLTTNVNALRDFYSPQTSDPLADISALLSRFHYADALLLCQRGPAAFPDPLYAFGSVVELGNILPRPIWPTRPHLSFNHHVTHSVWGRPQAYFLEMPIGRIGESFFVAGWAGLFYASIYGALWSLLTAHFAPTGGSDFKNAIYLSLLLVIVFPDAYLMYNWKVILIYLVTYRLSGTVHGATQGRIAAPRAYPAPQIRLDGRSAQ